MQLRSRAFVALLLFFLSLPAFAQWRWGRPQPPQGGACFYKDANFGNQYFCMHPGERWPVLPRGFNDQISSIRIFGDARVRIFNDANFGGASLLIDQDIYNLKQVPLAPGSHKNWNDRISAIAVFRGRDEWEERYPPPPPPAYPGGRPY